MSPAVPPKALSGVVPSLVELKVLPKAFKNSVWTHLDMCHGINGCLFKWKIPTLKIIFVLQCFPCLLFFHVFLSAHTHIYFSFAFCCMENPKVSKKLKAGSEKLYNIQGCSLVGNLEESKKSVKNYSLFVVLFCRQSASDLAAHPHLFP